MSSTDLPTCEVQSCDHIVVAYPNGIYDTFCVQHVPPCGVDGCLVPLRLSNNGRRFHTCYKHSKKNIDIDVDGYKPPRYEGDKDRPKGADNFKHNYNEWNETDECGSENCNNKCNPLASNASLFYKYCDACLDGHKQKYNYKLIDSTAAQCEKQLNKLIETVTRLRKHYDCEHDSTKPKRIRRLEDTKALIHNKLNDVTDILTPIS